MDDDEDRHPLLGALADGLWVAFLIVIAALAFVAWKEWALVWGWAFPGR